MDLAGLPAFPLGNAAVMRARATRLRALADEVTAITHGVEGARGSLDFEGPAGDRLRHRIHSARSAPTAAAHELRATAAYLNSEADRLELAQAAWRKLKARLEAEAKAALGGSDGDGGGGGGW